MTATEFNKKLTYRKTMYFSEDFLNEMELFLKNIKVDSRIKQDFFKNDEQRFSAMLRMIIAKYNQKFSEFLNEKRSARENEAI